MKYYTIAIVLLIFAFIYIWQINTLPNDWKNFTDQVDNDFKAYDFLEKISLEIGGRISGTQKEKETEKYIIDLLKSSGYSDLILHEFNHLSWQRKSCNLKIRNSKNEVLTSIEAKSLGMTPAESFMNSYIIDLNSGTTADYKKYSKDYLKEKIVLVDNKSPVGHKIVHRVDKINIARNMGAKGVILFNQVYGNIITVGTASFGSNSQIPAVSITRENGLELKQMIQTDSIAVELNVQNIVSEKKSRNIAAKLKGNELANEIVLISAHFDAWDVGQGAVDNGANVSVVLELARQFQKLNINTKRTILFTFFNAEELGLVGSKKFIQDNPSLIDNIFYVINLEMNISPIGINLLLYDEHKLWFSDLVKNLTSLGMQKSVINDPWLESDHAYFMLKGIPTLTFREKTDIFAGQKYHSSGDNIDLISKNDLLNCVKIVGLILKEIANTEEIKKWHLNEEELQLKIDQAGLSELLKLRGMSI